MQNKIWTTLEKDPVFSQSLVTESMEEQRRKTFLRVKRLFEYNMINDDEVFSNPLKHKIFTDSLGMYDWSVMAKFQLSVEFTGGSIGASGTTRHADISQKFKTMEVIELLLQVFFPFYQKNINKFTAESTEKKF